MPDAMSAAGRRVAIALGFGVTGLVLLVFTTFGVPAINFAWLLFFAGLPLEAGLLSPRLGLERLHHQRILVLVEAGLLVYSRLHFFEPRWAPLGNPDAVSYVVGIALIIQGLMFMKRDPVRIPDGRRSPAT